MKESEIKEIVERRRVLVETATSEAQREIYRGYLDFWTEKLPKRERPEAIAKREEAKAKKEAEEHAKFEIEEKAKEEAEELRRTKATEEEAKAKKVAELKAKLKVLEDTPTPIVEIVIDENTGTAEFFKESDLGDIFELENPGKKAYRTQNGDKTKTIAFKEYLNQRTE